MKAIMLESRLRKWWVTLIQSNGEVMIGGGNVSKIDPAQWPTIGTQEPTGADTSFDKWNYYCSAVWSFSWARLHSLKQDTFANVKRGNGASKNEK